MDANSHKAVQEAMMPIRDKIDIGRAANIQFSALEARLEKSIVLLADHISVTKGLKALHGDGALAAKDVSMGQHTFKQLSACSTEGSAEAVGKKASIANALAQVGTRWLMFNVVHTLPDTPNKKCIDDMIREGAKSFREALRTLARPGGVGEMCLACPAASLELCTNVVAILGEALGKLEKGISSFAEEKGKGLMERATELEAKYLTEKEHKTHNAFLDAFAKPELKDLSPLHKKLGSDLDSVVEALTSLGELELPEGVKIVQDIVVRLSCMSIKWAMYSLLSQDVADPGSADDRIVSLVDRHFGTDIKEKLDKDIYETVYNKAEDIKKAKASGKAISRKDKAHATPAGKSAKKQRNS